VVRTPTAFSLSNSPGPPDYTGHVLLLEPIVVEAIRGLFVFTSSESSSGAARLRSGPLCQALRYSRRFFKVCSRSSVTLWQHWRVALGEWCTIKPCLPLSICP
jgi:hypothetical protein